MEQLANLRGRYAEHLWQAAAPRTHAVQKKVDALLVDGHSLLTLLVD